MSSTQQQPLVHKVNEPTLLFHTNLFIISVFALCFLIILPRIIYKLSTRDGWVEGHFFRRSTFRPRPARPSLIPSATSASSSYSHSLAPLSIASPTSASEKRGFWGGGQTPVSPSDAPSSASSWFPGVSVSRSSSSSSTQSSASVGESYPPHIAFTPSFLIPVSKWLKRRLAYKSDRSYGQTLVQITWLAILMYPTFYKSSGPLKDPLRIGWVAVSQLPFLFVLSAKNGILGALLGVGYHKVNFLHRFAGRLVVFGSNLHALGYIYKWSLAGTFTEMISRPKTYWALVALVAINLLFFLSTSFIRHNFFNFFLFMHIASWLVLLPTLYFHGKRMAPYLLACVAVTTLDRVMRVMKTRVSEALIKPVPELGGTRIEIPGIEGWEAGQHVRIRILSSGMGLNHSFGASHPFTIASPSGGRSGLVLYCKKSLPESGTTGRGNWTNRLYELAKVKGYLSKEEQGGVGRKIKVMVQGPYGGPDSHTVLASYSAAVFVVGGSGISYALSGIQEMLGKDYKNQSRVRQIELMWMVRDPSCLVPMMETFSAMLRKSASVMTSLKISVYYTRAPVGGVLPFKDDDPILSHPDMLSLSPGRPRVGKTIEGVMSRLVRLGTSRKTRGKITGMVVCVCGPKGLAGDVSDAVNQLDPARCARIGGVEVHEEVFGL